MLSEYDVEVFFEMMNSFDTKDFFQWFREQTESRWRVHQETPLETLISQGTFGPDWQSGTRWIGGFSHDEITEFERSFELVFPAEYRYFLSTLGAPDRLRLGMRWRGQQQIQVLEPSFYHWQRDIDEIKQRLYTPLEGILQQLEYGIWGNHWGERPTTMDGQIERVSELAKLGGQLIPLIGHRYLVNVPGREMGVVLSIVQRDIIVFGMDLRRFLLLELAPLLELDKQRIYEFAIQGYEDEIIGAIPLWGDIITGKYSFVEDV